jgi:hypothetical protein
VPDPANPQDLNRYSYVRNNPLKYTDPSGHIPLPLITGAAGFVIGGVAYVVNESRQEDGFNLAEDWVDLAVAASSGAVSGAMISTPLGIGMAAAQAGDHITNLMFGEDFSAAGHMLEGVTGGAAGFVAKPAALLGKTGATQRLAQAVGTSVVEGVGVVAVDAGEGQATWGSFLRGATWGLANIGYGKLTDLGKEGLSRNQETVWNLATGIYFEGFKGGSQGIFNLNNQHYFQ